MKVARGLFCNNCGYLNAGDVANCAVCGLELHSEPQVSDTAPTFASFCAFCAAANIQGANYCHACGRKFSVQSEHVTAVKGGAADAAFHSSHSGEPLVNCAPRHESFLDKLDRMEMELESKQNDAVPGTAPVSDPDHLDTHEETLKNIAFTLDTLIADLLEAETREYIYPEFMHPGETGFQMKKQELASQAQENSGKSLQEIVVISALVTAIFLVGMTFGLWGSFFFGL